MRPEPLLIFLVNPREQDAQDFAEVCARWLNTTTRILTDHNLTPELPCRAAYARDLHQRSSLVDNGLAIPIVRMICTLFSRCFLGSHCLWLVFDWLCALQEKTNDDDDLDDHEVSYSFLC